MLDLEENKRLLYPKIETAFIRGDDFKFIKGVDVMEENIDIEGKTWLEPGYAYRLQEFNEIASWQVTEKINGTNIRVALIDGKLHFWGKTEAAEIPKHLINKLNNLFNVDKLMEVFEGKDVCLYGEGYGAKIQEGKDGGVQYSKDAEFILFDVRVGDFWLSYPNIADVAEKLNIDVVPLLGKMTTQEIVKLVKNGFPSIIGDIPICEGIVAKSETGLMTRNGERVMYKLKHKDFKKK
jgi:ATP-dependent RNA circularization protein (DNA/RNA ligase family)